MEELKTIFTLIIRADDYMEARAIADKYLKPDTVIPHTLFKLALRARANMYNPLDKGMYGKLGEIEARMDEWNSRKWARWNEFTARKHGYADIGKRTENKTGTGDWLYSRRYASLEEIVAEYAKKQTIIRWATEDFCIVCTWAELFEYLAEYNAKGIYTWFNSCLKYNANTSETIVKMQEYKTSKRKTLYLISCPYNQD